MNKEKQNEILARCNECVEMFEQFYEGKHNKYSAAYSLGTIRQISKDIPILLDYLHNIETAYNDAMKEFFRVQERNQALENAIKNIQTGDFYFCGACQTCKHNDKFPGDFCIVFCNSNYSNCEFNEVSFNAGRIGSDK